MSSYGFYRFCVSGTFQALIQYADMLSAQTAKYVSIHLAFLSPPPPLHLPPPLASRRRVFSPALVLFLPSAISASVVFPPLRPPVFPFQFFIPLPSWRFAIPGRRLCTRAPAGQIEIFRGISRGGNEYSSADLFLLHRRKQPRRDG